MQAARLLEPRPRTVRAKLIEIARALQLEARFSKREILGIWLTLAPMGGNLEGVRAGRAGLVRHRPPRLLEPRSPRCWWPSRAGRRRCGRTAIPTAPGHCVTASWRRPAGRRPRLFPPPGLRLPRHARQAVGALLAAARVATTLDLPLQIALERLADERLETLPGRASLALLVADAASRDIRALVSGGSGPGEGRGGALDLTRAVRSPGSAMKPFLYALAFQDGIAGPNTVLADLPRRFGAYAPENFDRGFAGSVTAAEALRRSLNLPAVALLDRVGPLRFAATLKAAGVPLRLPEWRRCLVAAGARRGRHHSARGRLALRRPGRRRRRGPAAPAAATIRWRSRPLPERRASPRR